jgi:C-terminal processing protease CtpA/Prc
MPVRAGRLTPRPGKRLVAFVWLFLFGAGLLAQPGLSSRDRDLALSMLRQVREDIEKHYYDPSFHGINLKAQAGDAERRLTAAPTLTDAFAVIADFLFQFDDSHTVFIPPDRRTRVDYGWSMAMVGDVPLILSVDPRSDAAAQGLAPGDRVLLLNAFAPRRANLGRLAYIYRFIKPEARQRVAVLKPNGAAITVDVASQVEPRRASTVEELFEEIGQLVERARDRSIPVGDDVLVWKMAVFGQAESVDRMIAKAREYRTLVLDVRGNGGGSVDSLRELVSRCLDHDVVVASEKRRGKESREMARPARTGFAGRLIVLVDSRSGSAAEMFARIVQLEKRGIVIGDRTAGAVMMSRLFPHAAGAALYAASVTIADVRMSDGGSLEHVGVEPDEIVLPTPSDLAAGRDPALAHAVALAGGSLTAEEAGKLFR